MQVTLIKNQDDKSKCPCGSGKDKEAVHDCHNIFYTYVCSVCREEKLKDVNLDYSQDDVTETIEPEDYY